MIFKPPDTLPDIPEPASSRNELDKFMESHIWLDFKTYMEWRKEGTISAMREANDTVAIYRAQGALEVVDDILLLPKLLWYMKQMREPIEDNNG